MLSIGVDAKRAKEIKALDNPQPKPEPEKPKQKSFKEMTGAEYMAFLNNKGKGLI